MTAVATSTPSITTDKKYWKQFDDAIELVKKRPITDFLVYDSDSDSGRASITYDLAFPPDQALSKWIMKRGGSFTKTGGLALEMEPYAIKIIKHLSPKVLELNVKSSYVNSEFYKVDDATVVMNLVDEDVDNFLPYCPDHISRKMKAVVENKSIDQILGELLSTIQSLPEMVSAKRREVMKRQLALRCIDAIQDKFVIPKD